MRNITQGNNLQQTIKNLLCAAAVMATAYGVPTLVYAQSASAATDKPMMKMDKMGMDKSMGMHKSMNDMQEKMATVPMSGDPDINFAAMMRIHHQGAVDMAQMEIDVGKNPDMIKMAKGIIAAQKKEIAQFDAWLKKHPAK